MKPPAEMHQGKACLNDDRDEEEGDLKRMMEVHQSLN